MAIRAVELYWTREWDDWTGFPNALKYTLILSVVQWAFWFHAYFKGSVLPLFISGEKKCLLWLKAPFCVCSSVLCASIYNTNECGHMYFFSFSYTQTLPCACWSGKRSVILLQTVAEYKHKLAHTVYLTGPPSAQNRNLLNCLLGSLQVTEVKLASCMLNSPILKITR